jgi:uncharacterized tellurite resistance protein B-like protein
MYDNWTKEQKLAVIRILMDIAAADNFLDVSEMNFILETCKDLGLHRNVVLTILQTTPVRKALPYLSKMEEHEKIDVANLMRRLIDIDGQVDKNEIKIFTVVMNEMGFEILG